MLRPLHRIIFLLAATLLAISGFESCNDGVITFTGGNARVRIFNAQLKSNDMRVEIDTQLRVQSLSNGSVSSDFSLSSGLFHSFVCRSTTDTTVSGTIAAQRYMFADNATYLLVVHGWNITDFMAPVPEISQSPNPSKAAMRVINATDTVSASVSVDATVLFKLADIQSSTNLAYVEPGNYVVYTNNKYADAEIDHRTVSFVAGKVYDLIIYDSPYNNGLTQKVIIREVN